MSRDKILLCQNIMGHRTHANMLEAFVAGSNFQSMKVVRFSVRDEGVPWGVPYKLWSLRLPGDHLQRRTMGDWQHRSFVAQSSLALRALCRESSTPQLLYVHTQMAAGVALKVSPTIPIVVSIDGTSAQERRMYGVDSTMRSDSILAREREVFQRADAIISFSAWAKESVVDDYGIDPKKVHIFRNGILLPRQEQVPRAIARKDNMPTIGFVANDFVLKGGDLLLETHQRYLADRVHLILVTKEKIAADHYRNLSVMRDVPHDRLLREVLPLFDALVHPTNIDRSPFAVIEALGAGLPVVTTDLGSLREMVEHGVNGMILPIRPSASELAVAIMQTLEEPRRTQWGTRSREIFEDRYSAEKVYPQLLSFVDQVGGTPNADEASS